LVIFDELTEQVLHQMHDADSSYLVTRHLHQVVAQLILLGVEIASFDKDFLLLNNNLLQGLDPVQDVPVTCCQLVSSPYFNQIV
jgi:hypothetical protein